MKFPSIEAVAHALRHVNANVEGECDVRLQVWEDGEWAVRWGLSDYDTDHRGFWGAGSVPGVAKGKVTRFNTRDLAAELIRQAKDQAFSG
jgi:hypothetical protein